MTIVPVAGFVEITCRFANRRKDVFPLKANNTCPPHFTFEYLTLFISTAGTGTPTAIFLTLVGGF
jgi:hypothetical protein